jgi:hypothetical protein
MHPGACWLQRRLLCVGAQLSLLTLLLVLLLSLLLVMLCCIFCIKLWSRRAALCSGCPALHCAVLRCAAVVLFSAAVALFL